MKTIWIGVIEGIFGYGISVAETTEEKCMEALEAAYNKWAEGSGMADDYEDIEHDGTPYTRFEKAFEHWGGSVQEIELGKSYFDNFKS